MTRSEEHRAKIAERRELEGWPDVPAPEDRDTQPTNVRALRRFSTANGLHQEGEVVTLPRWKADLYCDRPNPITMRLTDSEESAKAEEEMEPLREAATTEPGANPNEAGVEEARREQLRQAIARLDHSEDAHWTERGEPQVAAVNAQLLELGYQGDTTSRAELRHLVASETRQVATVED